jgi:hypothetical protein
MMIDTTLLVAIGIWVGIALLIAGIARLRGMDPADWFWGSIVFTPLVAGLFVLWARPDSD